jgi:hypothetical protein
MLYRGAITADTTASAPPNTVVPFELAGVGFTLTDTRAFVLGEPTEIRAQLTFAVTGA